MSARRAKRLTADVRPIEVDLHLEVDPERDDTFSGSVRIEIELERAKRQIELHATEIDISRAGIVQGGEILPGTITVVPERETVKVRLPALQGPGRCTLVFAFNGRLRSDLKGFYHAASGRHRYALTQLAATHARRMFPCFDEPAMKAAYKVSVTTRKGLTVLSNQPAERVEPARRGFVTHHFSRTPRLSSYLVAIAVGRFEGSRTVRVGKTPIRVWHTPGKAALTPFALRAAKASLARLEKWFGLAHPYQKLDLIAVPDFEFGAMENAGAVFFRETALLLDETTASPAERHRVAEVVAHELSHMWFGNLVTMAWWDDLWLNESFATWMAFQVIDDWKPGWGIWREFQDGTATALRFDALADTHPVYCEVHDVDAATENFDVITYEKGAAIVRMLATTLGPDFRRGVRRYIRAHCEGNTVAADLWQALGEASGRDVLRMAGAWIERPGHPIVELTRSRDGGRIQLAQRPFRMGRRRGAVDPESLWPVPWAGRALSASGRTRRIEATLARSRTRVDVPAGTKGQPVYGNANQGGFFRTLHAPEELAEIASRASGLTAIERMGLIDDAWALARAGELPLVAFLELIPAIGAETDPAVLRTLAGAVHALSDDVRHLLEAEAIAIWRKRLQQIFGPLRGDPFEMRRGSDDSRDARAQRLGILGADAACPLVIEAAKQACRRYLARPASLHPAFADVAVSLAAEHGHAALFDRLERTWRTASTPQLARRALMALAGFRDAELHDRALAHTLGPELASGDVAIVLVRGLSNPHNPERTWRFIKCHWSALEKRIGGMLVTRIIDATPALATAAARRDVAAFFQAHPVPTGERAIRQALERFELIAAFRRRAAPELRAWLST